ncbi:hypothetical protein SELMODRAFT_429828 [Selaginella moellendorffii]|uniref:Carbamoyl phosphate synthase small chain, chloroplastic n=1 Tax=Selaginella moellendorffii TaxID=88036 RepID=D8T7F8_SELML|nr:hypothetical protein SELMODRAFT_429828 [Selaginella moellendorffii]
MAIQHALSSPCSSTVSGKRGSSAAACERHGFRGSQLRFGYRHRKCGRSLQVFCCQSAPAAATEMEVERPWKTKDTRLVLQDGSVWNGKSFGASGTQVGEVVFNTAMTGYQEIITDPSYAGQFVVMTQPHIGNTGVNFEDEESSKCHLCGLIVRSLSDHVSNWRATQTLAEYLQKRNIMGIWKDLISGVSCTRPYEWKDTTRHEWEFSKDAVAACDKLQVVAYDFGVKRNILQRLASYGCNITVVPSNWPVSEVMKLKPDGILFSNGPGDPSAVPYAVETVKELLGQVPVFGICMGHQLLGQALGGKTFKMKFGHHGGNHPVRHLPTGRVEISSQNHNYAVDIATLPEGVEVTHVNLNDGTCAGLTYTAMKVMGIQYHPESSPGPHDADPAFFEFVQMMIQNRLLQ